MSKELLQEKFAHLLDETLINQINLSGTLKTFEKDDIIIDINQTLSYIPLLLSGSIKILREDNDGNELLIYFLESGETCTMSLTCCMGTSKSKVRAVAEKDSMLIMIPVSIMQTWFHNNETRETSTLSSEKGQPPMERTLSELTPIRVTAMK